jgi:hypothetical protein
VEVDGYMTDLLTERSIRLLPRKRDSPFLIDVTYNAPHWPYQVPDRSSVARDNAAHLQPQSHDRSTRADFLAEIERANQGMGEILATLE